jgi:hypothetical protein
MLPSEHMMVDGRYCLCLLLQAKRIITLPFLDFFLSLLFLSFQKLDFLHMHQPVLRTSRSDVAAATRGVLSQDSLFLSRGVVCTREFRRAPGMVGTTSVGDTPLVW